MDAVIGAAGEGRNAQFGQERLSNGSITLSPDSLAPLARHSYRHGAPVRSRGSQNNRRLEASCPWMHRLTVLSGSIRIEHIR